MTATSRRPASIAVTAGAAAGILGATFVRIPDGGHLRLGHQAEARATVGRFIARCAAGPAPMRGRGVQTMEV